MQNNEGNIQYSEMGFGLRGETGNMEIICNKKGAHQFALHIEKICYWIISSPFSRVAASRAPFAWATGVPSAAIK